MIFKIFRFDPDKDKRPHYDILEIKKPAPDLTVLEVLQLFQRKLDSSLCFRSSCRAGVCGSCALKIKGKPCLACSTIASGLINPTKNPEKTIITIEPLLDTLPLIRDLVVDLETFFENYEIAKPFLIPKTPVPQKEFLQTPKERQKLDPLVDCILCGCCYESCPAALFNPKYLGPHALVALLRFMEDSRDQAKLERLKIALASQGIRRCHSVFNCSLNCPKNIDPGAAIARMKRQMIVFYAKSLLKKLPR